MLKLTYLRPLVALCTNMRYCVLMQTTAGHSTRLSRRDILSAHQAADYLGVSESLIRKLWASGDLPSFKMGELRRTRRGDLDDWITARIAEGREDRI